MRFSETPCTTPCCTVVAYPRHVWLDCGELSCVSRRAELWDGSGDEKIGDGKWGVSAPSLF